MYTFVRWFGDQDLSVRLLVISGLMAAAVVLVLMGWLVLVAGSVFRSLLWLVVCASLVTFAVGYVLLLIEEDY